MGIICRPFIFSYEIYFNNFTSSIYKGYSIPAYLPDVIPHFPPTNEVFFCSHKLSTNIAGKWSNLQGEGEIRCIKQSFYTCANK